MARGRVVGHRASTLRVRKAGLRDLDILVRQRRAMWTDLGVRNESLHDKADRTYRRWAATRLRNRQMLAWIVVSRDGKIAGGGCLWLQQVQPSPKRPGTLQPYILSMFTESSFRHRGVASMVVSEAIRWCVRQGYPRLALHASEMGREVYKKFGFKRTWEMRLDLKKAKNIEPKWSG